MARAALESIAFQTRDVLEAMLLDSGVDLTSLEADGGMVVNDLLMQFQADIVDVPVVRPVVVETTALGAAYAAGLAVGFWDDFDELKAKWRVGRSWEPTMSDQERDRLLNLWEKAVERTFGWID